MLPSSVDTIIINTGNLINSKELKKKALQSPSEEVYDSVSSSFQTYLKDVDLQTKVNTLMCNNSPSNKDGSLERADLKISVKVFLENYSPESLKTSILQAMKVIDVQTIDSLILTLPAISKGETFDLNKIKPLWSQLENLVREEKLITIGISDFDTEDLVVLYNWTQIKPSVNQVNLESCCVMPTEMIAFAKENDIQLLTHNDPKVLLPNEMLHQILEPGVTNPNEWGLDWIVRYSVVVRCRGIIQNKGYLFCTSKT